MKSKKLSGTRSFSHLRKFNVVGTHLSVARDLRMNDSVIIFESAGVKIGALTYLEVDNYKEDNHSSQQAGNVRRVFTVEGVLEGQHFVGLGQQGVEEGDDGTFEFGVLLSLDRNR